MADLVRWRVEPGIPMAPWVLHVPYRLLLKPIPKSIQFGLIILYNLIWLREGKRRLYAHWLSSNNSRECRIHLSDIFAHEPPVLFHRFIRKSGSQL